MALTCGKGPSTERMQNMPPEENTNQPLINWGAIFLAGVAKHVFDCLKMFSTTIDGETKYWSDELPEEEDGIITIKLKIPVEDAYFWWQANSHLAVEAFQSPKQWRERIQERANA